MHLCKPTPIKALQAVHKCRTAVAVERKTVIFAMELGSVVLAMALVLFIRFMAISWIARTALMVNAEIANDCLLFGKFH